MQWSSYIFKQTVPVSIYDFKEHFAEDLDSVYEGVSEDKSGFKLKVAWLGNLIRLFTTTTFESKKENRTNVCRSTIKFIRWESHNDNFMCQLKFLELTFF